MSKSLTVKWCILVVFLLTTTFVCALEQRRVFFSFDASNGLADNSAQTIMCTKTGRMVISTIGHINFYDGDAFSHIDPTAEDVFPLPKYNGHYHLYFDKHHHLWLKDKHSVTCLDLLTERFIQNVDSVIKTIGMKRPVEDLFGDTSNHLWFVSKDRIYSVEHKTDLPVRKGVELQDIDAFGDSILLQFYADDVVRAYELNTRRHLWDSKAFQDVDSMKYSRSSVLCPYGHSYFQIRNGEKEAVLLRFNAKTQQWQQIMATPYHLNNMAVFRNRLYVASEYGYWIYDIKTGVTHHERELRLTSSRNLLTDVNTVAFDRQGGMWIGTEKRGLLYSKPIKSPFVCYTWEDKESIELSAIMDRELPAQGTLARHENCRYTDSRGWVWSGLYTGLQLHKPGSSKPKVFTRRDGLRNEMIHSVVEDDDHNIWVGTSFGISRLVISNGEVSVIETYTQVDNVPNESFANGRAMKLPDGDIVMQQLDHVIRFNPQAFHHDSIRKMVLYPKLIRVQVNGTNIKPGMKINGKVILEKAVTRIHELCVDYNQNSVSLTFSGLNYFRPQQTYYRFRVKGISDQWQVLSYHNSNGLVDGKGLLHMPLLALRPGTYEIEVQASMSPDVWSAKPFMWILKVEEPWWRTTGIYLLLALLLLATGLYNLFLFHRNLRLRIACKNEERDLLRRIRNYVDRCNNLANEVLTPYSVSMSSSNIINEENVEFNDAMMKIVPYVNKQKGLDFSVRDLSELTGIEIGELYNMLTENLYKSPRPLAIRFRLRQAIKLLRQTDMSVEAVADQCNFVSPNYFIACFYHQYRKTPDAYRSGKA